MKKRFLFILGLFLLTATTTAYSQDDNISTQKMQRQADRAKKKRMDGKDDENKKPLTENQARRAMSKRDKKQKEAYEEHHERIQAKETKKRMRKNKRNSKYVNSNKKPNKLQRLFLRGRKK